MAKTARKETDNSKTNNKKTVENTEMEFEDTTIGDGSEPDEIGGNEEENTGRDRKKNIYDILEEEIVASDIPEKEKVAKLSNLLRLRSRKVNILVVGATGVGKSSTINALFNMEIAKVGIGVDPETSLIEQYVLDNLTIWDTPGLGDNVERDREIKRQIVAKLNETDENDNSVIDLVLVLFDASTKDLGTTYDLINNVLIPCLEGEASKRIIIGLNQSDLAMKGAHWDKERNMPDDVLAKYLERKARSVSERIREATGLKLHPVTFCAGYMEGCDPAEIRRPYNLTALLYHIVKAVPKDKRLVLVNNLNEESENWEYDDGKDDYKELTIESFFESVGNSIASGMEDGCEIGEDLMGIPGMLVGAVVGGLLGTVRGFVGTVLGKRY